MNRACGIAAGIANHLLFAITVYFLFGFLAGWTGPGEPFSVSAISWDVLLTLQFAISHSWLLLPRTRERIARIIPKPFYGTLFCTATCFSLLTTIGLWRPIDVVVSDFDGSIGTAISMAFIVTWAVLFYSLSLTGLGYQTGFTPWLYWLRGQPLPRRDFEPKGLYHWFRHPIYFSFLGLLWLTPRVTLDRSVLIAMWSTYIFIGSMLKDRRLVHYLGDSYRQYQARVVGYPGILFGPLGRVPLPQVNKQTPQALESTSSRAA